MRFILFGDCQMDGHKSLRKRLVGQALRLHFESDGPLPRTPKIPEDGAVGCATNSNSLARVSIFPALTVLPICNDS